MENEESSLIIGINNSDMDETSINNTSSAKNYLLEGEENKLVKFGKQYLKELIHWRSLVIICVCTICLCWAFVAIILIAVLVFVDVRNDPGLVSIILKKNGDIRHCLYNPYLEREISNTKIDLPSFSLEEDFYYSSPTNNISANTDLKSASIDNYVNVNCLYWLYKSVVYKTITTTSDTTIFYENVHSVRILGVNVWDDGIVYAVGENEADGGYHLFTLDQGHETPVLAFTNLIGFTAFEYIVFANDFRAGVMYVIFTEKELPDEKMPTQYYFLVDVRNQHVIGEHTVREEEEGAKKVVSLGYDPWERELFAITSDRNPITKKISNGAHKLSFNSTHVHWDEKCEELYSDNVIESIGTTYTYYSKYISESNTTVKFHIANLLWDTNNHFESKNIKDCGDYHTMAKGRVMPGDHFAVVMNPHQKKK